MSPAKVLDQQNGHPLRHVEKVDATSRVRVDTPPTNAYARFPALKSITPETDNLPSTLANAKTEIV